MRQIYTLTFVDAPSPGPEPSARSYAGVLGWTVEGARPERSPYLVGGEFTGPDGTRLGVGSPDVGRLGHATPVPDPEEPSSWQGLAAERAPDWWGTRAVLKTMEWLRPGRGTA